MIYCFIYLLHEVPKACYNHMKQFYDCSYNLYPLKKNSVELLQLHKIRLASRIENIYGNISLSCIFHCIW